MIVEKYYHNNGHTIYKCDRCGKIIDTGKEKRYRNVIQTTNSNKTMKTIVGYDLCKHCASVIKYGIERGVTKK